MLESPTFIYGGILGGLVVGFLSGTPGAEPGEPAAGISASFDEIKHATSKALPDDDPLKGKLPGDWLVYCIVGGALVGLTAFRLRQFDDRRRFWAAMGIVAAIVAIAGDYVTKVPGLDNASARFNFGMYLLLGLPFIYLLNFCGDADESEVDLMVFCGVLGAGLQLVNFANFFPGLGEFTSYLIPLTLYFVYATRIMPGLRVFKHILRGFSYMHLDRLRHSIHFFRRALELDPRSPLANRGMLGLHNNLTPEIDNDPELVSDSILPLSDRAATLLMPPTPPPSQKDREEGERFLSSSKKSRPISGSGRLSPRHLADARQAV